MSCTTTLYCTGMLNSYEQGIVPTEEMSNCARSVNGSQTRSVSLHSVGESPPASVGESVGESCSWTPRSVTSRCSVGVGVRPRCSVGADPPTSLPSPRSLAGCSHPPLYPSPSPETALNARAHTRHVGNTPHCLCWLCDAHAPGRYGCSSRVPPGRHQLAYCLSCVRGNILFPYW